jgi:MFS family permease
MSDTSGTSRSVTSPPAGFASDEAATPLLAQRSFLAYLGARCVSEYSYQIATVAIGWQIYELTGSAFQLGMVGLVQFIPSALLVFAAGHVADRYDRRRIAQICQLTEALINGGLAWGTFAGWLTAPQIFAALTVLGITAAFEGPAGSALLPSVVPEGSLQKATAISSGTFQAAAVSGPALGGVAYAIAPGAPYVVMAVCSLLAVTLTGMIKLRATVTEKETASFGDLFAGVRFVRDNPAILGTISLDLVAVLLGGATALLPIYAHDILQTGPWGLGVLRAAPAAGALLMTAVLARHAIKRKVGLRMFQAVIVFGLATIVFAFSHLVWLSLLALLVMGAADMVSVVIRSSLVQLATPDEMRGRVGAVNFLFINASNQLGQFESGISAALIGAMPAAVAGGVGTVAVALLWMKLFPGLSNMERLE